MRYTVNYNLKKPEGTDVANIDDLNENADIIDQKLKELKDDVYNVPPNSVNDLAIGTRTPNQTQVPTSPGSGTLSQILSWLANRIKAITGKTNWWDAPPTTLQAAKTHMDAAAPHSGHETPSGAQAKANTALNSAKQYTDQEVGEVAQELAAHKAAAAPHSGHETPAGAQAKAEAAAGAVQAELDEHLNDYVKQMAFATASGTNTYTVTIDGITELVEGLSVKVKFTNANTGASTLNINSLGAKAIKKGNGNALAAGNIKAGQICHLVYTGANFQLLGEGGEYGTAQTQHVLEGYTIGTEEGIKPGTMPDRGAVVITPSTQNKPIDEGYHNGEGYVKGDVNLKPSNVKKGVSIFGVEGEIEEVIYSVSDISGRLYIYVSSNDTFSELNPSTLTVIKSASGLDLFYWGAGGISSRLYSTSHNTIYEINPDTFVVIKSKASPSRSTSDTRDIGGTSTRLFLSDDDRCYELNINTLAVINSKDRSASSGIGGMSSRLFQCINTTSKDYVYEINPDTFAIINSEYEPGGYDPKGIGGTSDRLYSTGEGSYGASYIFELNPDTLDYIRSVRSDNYSRGIGGIKTGKMLKVSSTLGISNPNIIQYLGVNYSKIGG